MSNSRRLEVQGVAVLSMYVVSDNGHFHLDNQNERNRYSYGANFVSLEMERGSTRGKGTPRVRQGELLGEVERGYDLFGS